MNYFNVFIFFVFSFLYGQENHFVKFISDDVHIIQESNQTIITLPFEILEGYHIQLEKVEDENLLATKLDFENQPDIEIIYKQFTSLQYKTVVLDKKEFQVLDDSFKVKVKIKFQKERNQIELTGKLFYQTCDDFKCYFPRELTFTIPIKK
ncbi:MAG: hypothetical protein KAJ28_06715 [Flavobacteriaceae bacterium]|nr:hypothetical protein [Flavobacteriaceae bacterium]